MITQDKITHLYPQAIPLVDFILQDNGQGVLISKWDVIKLGEQPTVENLAQIVVPPKVPEEVTMRQARLVLLQAGKLTIVETTIAAMQGAQGEAAKIEWQYSNTLKRSQPLVTSVGALLGLNSNQVDNLFITASTL